MKLRNYTGLAFLSVLLSGFAFSVFVPAAVFAQTQDVQAALQKGYRTGYSDGYMAGYRDTIDGAGKNYSRHSEYAKADRAFNGEYGSREDYRDAYQQGFEAGYGTGFERRSFESALPSNLKLRGYVKTPDPDEQPAQPQNTAFIIDNTPAKIDNDSAANSSDSDTAQPIQMSGQAGPYTPASASGATTIIPRDTEIMLELQGDLSTETSREGEKFTARVVSPSELAGAIVEGRVAKSRKPGRLKRHSELLLSFDRIMLDDNRWSNFSGTLTEVMAIKGDNIRRVDTEGTALGKSSLKRDAIKVGGATGAGLIIGGAVGGPVGAAVGASVGAAFGVGAVVIDRGKHVRLARNQQIRVRTAYETQIR
ncbi:MAG: hypothetical protein ABR530_04980 [Pyrinomonadaceae bacterium]